MRFSTAALIAVVALILCVTLWPDPASAELRAMSCVYCGWRASADAIANLILFVPLGAALVWAKPGIRGAWRYGLALSLAIELAQRFIAGRDASLGDIIMNTLGTQVGVLALRHIVAERVRPPRLALVLAASAAFALAIEVSATLLQPAPTAAVYYGQWTPNLGHLEWYRGRVLDAALDSVPLRAGRLADNSAVRTFVTDGGRLTVRAVAGDRTRRLASLVSVYDERRREIFLVGPDRDALVLRFRRGAAEWRFDEPDLRLEGAFANVRRGDTIAVTVDRTPAGACFALNATRACRPLATPGRGWSLLMYSEQFPAWLRGALDVVWLLALSLPAGWYAGTGRLLIAAVALPAAFAWFAVAPAVEVAAAVAGALLGAATRRLARGSHG